MELLELLQRVVANDIGVKDEKLIRVSLEEYISVMVQSTRTIILLID